MDETGVDKYKGNGVKWLTEGLFVETSVNPSSVLYSLQPWDKEYDGRHCPSLHKLYVEMEDLAEYNFANKYFDGYQHWLVIKEKPFFQHYYTKMVDELNAKLRGKALKVMLQQVAEGTASQATLKYLADHDYLPKKSAGRPKKQPKEDAKLVSLIKNDLIRIKG